MSTTDSVVGVVYTLYAVSTSPTSPAPVYPGLPLGITAEECRAIIREQLAALGLQPPMAPIGPPWLPEQAEPVDVEYMTPAEARQYR